MRTLQQLARDSGIPYQTLKKHVQRDKLLTHTEGGRLLVSDEDFEAYQLAERLAVASRAIDGKPLAEQIRDLGNAIAQLPQHVRDAILAGVPTQKSAGGPKAYHDATDALPRYEVPETSDDPHSGYPIGYQHASAPRWKRTSSSTWKLGHRSYAWNGFSWEPGGDARELADGISPASPHADLRPLGSSRTVREPK